MSDEALVKLRETPSATRVLVFIHGIGARDPQAYWKSFSTVLLEDPTPCVKEADVYVWGYPTNTGPQWLRDIIASLRRRTLVDTVPTISRLGDLWRSAYRTQFNAYHEMNLVCHSMGGLVVQSWITKVLAEGHSNELASLRFIAFYSTPQNGAPIAAVGWNDQLDGMNVTSEFVGKTRREWWDHVVKWNYIPMMAQDQSYNRFIPHLVLSGVNDAVVPRNCAEIIGMPVFDIPGDHSTLIQPHDPQDTRYKLWRDELAQTLSSPLRLPGDRVREVVAICYRRAIFTKMHAQLSKSAMLNSLKECRIALQQTITFVEPKEPRKLVAKIISELDLIERIGEQGDPDRIDEAKLRIIHALIQLSTAAQIPFDLPPSLTQADSFWSKEDADKSP